MARPITTYLGVHRVFRRSQNQSKAKCFIHNRLPLKSPDNAGVPQESDSRMRVLNAHNRILFEKQLDNEIHSRRRERRD